MHLAESPYLYKENVDIYLNALNECIFRRFGLVLVNILFVGGSAIITGHNFRYCTEDLDSFIKSDVDISLCIKDVSNMFSIPSDWMNSDFMKTKSYSPRLVDNAIFLKNYGCINLYRISDLDLLCMKLVSFRDKDINDIRGILIDCPYINQDMISNELIYLYGDDVFLDLKREAVEFVRLNVHR